MALGAFSKRDLRETGPRIGWNWVSVLNGEPFSRINHAISFLYAIIFSQSFWWENWAMYVWNWLQTTLFQTKLLNASNPSSILINETSHSLSTNLKKAPSFFGRGNHAATLMDVNGKYIICTIRLGIELLYFFIFSKLSPIYGIVVERKENVPLCMIFKRCTWTNN